MKDGMSPPIVGIDLGTTNSVIAIIRGGHPEVVPDANDEVIVPSVVLVDLDGKIVVGRDARAALVAMPDRTIAAVKRKMGLPDTVQLGGQSWRPEEISAMILRKLRTHVELLFPDQEIEAVITVPAYFNEAQRRATKEAGELAGFRVERIINEPTAAALAYGFYNLRGERYLLVYDLGGGTFDVSVIRMSDGALEVLASTGDRALGGEDFDWRLVDALAERIMAQAGVDPREDLAARATLKEVAEQMKWQLSDKTTAEASVPVLMMHNGRPVRLDAHVTRKQFEAMISPWLERTMQLVDEVVQEAHLSADQIHDLLLVGGSTRIPWVRDHLTNRFGKAPLNTVDPDLAVALGAAVQAGLKSGQIPESTMVATDVAPFSMGIAVAERDWLGRPIPGFYHPIISKNTTIPVARTDRFYTVVDNQTEIEVEVYQGEHPRVSQNFSLGSFLVKGLPPKPAGVEAIDVTFRYNLNGMLEVKARSVSTGEEMGMVVQDALDRASPEALEKSRQQIEALATTLVDQDDEVDEDAVIDQEDDAQIVDDGAASQGWDALVREKARLVRELAQIQGHKLVASARQWIAQLEEAEASGESERLEAVLNEATDFLIDCQL
ncbi:MAG: Hsp70 family protein [Firmicutes bacterium]|nr:Hsp70 family protein [Bacillota bacterium]